MTLKEIYQASEEHPIVFFDGVCNLCSKFIQWVIRNDKNGIIHFCVLQNAEGQRIREDLGLDKDISTVICISRKKVHTHSDVLFLIANRLGGWWTLLRPLYFIPKSLRDIVYNWVAKNRYNWFGKTDECMIPSQNISARFLTV